MGEEETCFSLLTGFSKFCFVDIPKISFQFAPTCIRNLANVWRFVERSLDNKSAAHCFSQLAARSLVHFLIFFYFFKIKSHLFCTLLLFTFFASRTPSPLVFPLCFLICVIPSCSHHASPATPPHLHLPSFCTIYLALTLAASRLARLIADSPSLSTSPPALPPRLPLSPSPLLPLFPGED